MEKSADFGPLLEVLVTCVGAVDVIALFAYMFDRKQKFESEMNDEDKEVSKINSKIDYLKPVASSRTRTPVRPTTPIPELRIEPDGAPQSFASEDIIEELSEKVHELEMKINDLEIRSREASIERCLNVERFRRSRTPSPELHRSRSCSPRRDSLDYDENFDEDEEMYEGRSSQRQGRMISRDDPLRRSIKRNSNKSLASQISREEELEQLTLLEQEEQANMDDFIPISYEGSSSPESFLGGFSPIPEGICPIHGDMEMERSPAPELADKVELPWGDVKKDTPLIKNQKEKFDMARSMSIEEEPNEEDREIVQEEEPNKKEREIVQEPVQAFEEKLLGKSEEEPIRNITSATENFLKQEIDASVKEKVNSSDDFIRQESIVSLESTIPYDESYDNLKPVEEPLIVPQVARELFAERFVAAAPLAEPEKDLECIATEAIVPGTPEAERKVKETTVDQHADSIFPDKLPSDVSNPKVTLNNQENDELAVDHELMNISRPSSGEGLKRSKRCLSSLDRSISRSPTPRLRSSRSRSRSRVPSEADYKDWFGKFNNQDSPELEVADEYEYDYEEAMDEEEEISLENCSDTQIQDTLKKKLTTNENDDVTSNFNYSEAMPKIVNDVSISVTLNLKKSKSDSNLSSNQLDQNLGSLTSDEGNFTVQNSTVASKVDDFLENERNESVSRRRMSIIPSTDEEQAKFTSMLHPEEFPIDNSPRPHIHHVHIHNKGYSEWMKKTVEHNSSHLALSDSGSDSDSPINDTDCIPRFQTEQTKKKRKSNRRPSPKN